MHERFTDRARKVLALANQAALRFNHEYIGTEHILLGLVEEGSGVGANVLKTLGVDLLEARLKVTKLVKSGPDMITVAKLPLTPRAKQVIDYAIVEARGMNHTYVGTEHLLLGLLREQDGFAAQVLVNLGLTLDRVREETLNLLGPESSRVAAEEGCAGLIRRAIEHLLLASEQAAAEGNIALAARLVAQVEALRAFLERAPDKG